MTDPIQSTAEDQQYLNAGYVPLVYDNQVVLIIPADVFVQVSTQISTIIAEAMKAPARRSGGNWGGKKEGNELGLFRVPPDVNAKDAEGKFVFQAQAGDTLKVPVGGYYFKKGQYPKVVFFSPFDEHGQPAKVGVQAASIQPGSKTWEKLFVKDGKSWEYDQTGQAHGLNLRVATLCVGEDKENPNKRFLFLVAIKPSEVQDAEALEYTV